MPQLLHVLLITLFLASPSWADQVFGPYSVDLPDDLHVTDCDDCTADQMLLLWKPAINAESLTAYYDYLKANDSDDVFDDALNQGVAGHLDLSYWSHGEKHSALTAQELHALDCAEFRASWGDGFCDFDQTRKLGHIATAIGAMVYVVCRYDEAGTICINGLDYIELGNTLTGTQHALARRFLQAWERHENLPNPEAERGLLNALRAAGNVAKIEELFGKITLRNGN